MGLNLSTISGVANHNLQCPGTDFIMLDKQKYGPLKAEIKSLTDQLNKMGYDNIEKRKEMNLKAINLLVELVKKLNSDVDYLKSYVEYIKAVQSKKSCKAKYDNYVSQLVQMNLASDLKGMSKDAKKLIPKNHPNTVLNVEIHKLTGDLIKKLDIPASVIKEKEEKFARLMGRK